MLHPGGALLEPETPGGQLPAKCLASGADLKPLLSTWAAVRLDLQDGGSPEEPISNRVSAGIMTAHQAVL